MNNSDTSWIEKRNAILLILLGFAGGAIWSFSLENYLFMLFLALSDIAVLYFYRQRQRECFKDERTQKIYYLSSWATFQLSILFFAFAGAFLISIRNLYPQYLPLGFHLAYISCGVFLLYTLFHIYYSHKCGARDEE
jgi:uncharacterized membrane protein